MKKRIILALSHTHGIAELIEENLKHCGFDVINISRHDSADKKFKYPSFWSWLTVRFKRDILKDREAKKALESAMLKKEVETLLGQNGNKADYILFFLAQTYSIEFIQYIREKVKSGGVINYQWDGLDRIPEIYSRLPLLDKTFVFDPDDLSKAENLYPTTSFYFDMDMEPVEIVDDFYFLGAHREDRFELVSKFTQYAYEKNWKLNFNLVINKKEKTWCDKYSPNVNFIDSSEAKRFTDNLLASRQAKVLLDFVTSAHKGLSLRTFEAIGYDKKLITTNAEVKKYDFYHSNNIFVLEDNFDELEDFLAKPYVALDPQIKQKYSFSNWINYVLNIEPHQPILLPTENEA